MEFMRRLCIADPIVFAAAGYVLEKKLVFN